MQKSEYFLKSLQAGSYEYRDWVLAAFTVTEYPRLDTLDKEDIYPYQLVRVNDNIEELYCVTPDDLDNPILIEDYLVNKPLLLYTDRIKLKPGDLINVKKEIDTNYGNCFLNCYLLIYPFGDKIEFMTGKMSGNRILSIITNNLEDVPFDGKPKDPKKFYVDELEKHANAVTSLDAFSFTCVPTTSETTMLPIPAVVKRRDELLKIHKDELHRPAVVAKIQAELASMDKEYFKTDRADGFYIGSKAYDIVRMKKFVMLGMIGGFGGNKPSLFTGSLAEGWDGEDMPLLVDEIRAGSYARGKSTAVAGGDVKLVYNAMQSVTIEQDDCGVKKGMEWLITDYNYGMFNGLWMIKGNELELLNADIVKQYIGKKITVRTPMLCKNPPPSFCAKCAGKEVSLLPNSVHITASNINSIYMGVSMSAMHGKVLKTRKFNIFSDTP